MPSFRTSLLAAALTLGAASPALAQDNPMVGGAAMYASKNIVENAVNSKDHTTLVAAVVSVIAGVALGEADLVPAWPSHAWLVVLALTSQVVGWLLISASLPRLPAALTFLTTLPRAKAITLLTHRLTQLDGQHATMASMQEHGGGWCQPDLRVRLLRHRAEKRDRLAVRRPAG